MAARKNEPLCYCGHEPVHHEDGHGPCRICSHTSALGIEPCSKFRAWYGRGKRPAEKRAEADTDKRKQLKPEDLIFKAIDELIAATSMQDHALRGLRQGLVQLSLRQAKDTSAPWYEVPKRPAPRPKKMLPKAARASSQPESKPKTDATEANGKGEHAHLTESMSRSERRLLAVLAQPKNALGVDRKKLAIWSGYSQRSGGYGQALADLRADGLIEGAPHAIRITQIGVTYAGAIEPLPTTGRELRRWWMNERPKGEGDVLEALALAKKPMTRIELAHGAGKAVTSGGYSQALANLRALGLIGGASNAITIHPELLG
jgi:hypothetical protein